ncbi:MAG: GxxExxY protein [Chitinophagales bacterium]
MKINEITSVIIEESIYIHKKLGPGLFENVYEKVLCFRLEKRGFKVEVQKAIPVIFEDIKLEIGFRADMIVDNTVLVEIKSVETLPKVSIKQVLTYLRLCELEVGLLINFNEKWLTDGLKRIIDKPVL